MHAETPARDGWRGTRWAAVVGLLFAVHAGALFFFSGWRPAEAAGRDAALVVRLAGRESGSPPMLDQLLLNDPALFARVGASGFSGPAWLQIQPPDFVLPEWTAPDRWLTQNVAGLGLDFRAYVRSHGGSVEPVPRPATPGLNGDAPPVTPPLATTSQLHVEGDLRTRAAWTPFALKAWPHDDLLEDSVVEVQVTPEGRVFSARLLGAPGVRPPVQLAADDHALEIARGLAFKPLPDAVAPAGPLTGGRISFQWRTVPPSPTNPPAQPRP